MIPTEGYELSPQQERLWQLRHRFARVGARAWARFDAPLRPDDVRTALRSIVREHEIYRTDLRPLSGLSLPIQVIRERAELAVAVDDLTRLDAAERAAAAVAIRAEFRAAEPTALTARYLMLTTGSAELLLAAPALCADARTMTNVLRAIAEGPHRDEVGGAQYKQFAAWQNALRAEPDDEGVAFWTGHVAGGFAPTLPLLRSWREDTPWSPEALSIAVDRGVVARLLELANASGATLESVLLAAFAVLAKANVQTERIRFGVVSDGRTAPELDTLDGPLARSLPLTFRVAADVPFDTLLGETAESLRRARELQDRGLPYADDAPDADPSYPLSFDFLELDAPVQDAWAPSEPFVVQLAARARERDLDLTMRFDPARVERRYAAHLLAQVETLLRGIAHAPSTPVDRLPLLDDRAAATIVQSGRGRTTPATRETLVTLLEAHVTRDPHAVAVVDASGALTYGELWERVGVVARRIAAAVGDGADRRIGVAVRPGRALPIAMFGAMAAGAAFVPIDLDNPVGRIRRILSDAGLAAIVADEPRPAELEAIDCPIVSPGPRTAADAADGGTIRRASPEDPAYVIYTSGSTGGPKGVVLGHAGAVNYALWLRSAFELGPKDGSVLLASFAYDLGYTSLFGALLNGGTLHLPDEHVTQDPESLVAYLREHAVTFLKLTPSRLRLVLASPAGDRLDALAELRLVLLGGEPIRVDDLRTLRERVPHATLVNHYGPTEATVGCIAEVIDLERFAVRPVLGAPIANMSALVLDRHGHIVAPGATGELHVAGPGLAIGYLGRPELTDERFVAHPYAPSERLYRTGDVGRCDFDGAFEFLGRIDDQTKISGFRVEPGEVERVLAGHPGVADAAVWVETDDAGAPRLAALVVPDRETARVAAKLCGDAGDLRWTELPDGSATFCLTEADAALQYREIVDERCYFGDDLRVPDGGTVFDVGANIGVFATSVARSARNVVVHAFEPIPETFRVLAANADLHGLDVRPHRAALGAVAGSVDFTTYPDYSQFATMFPDETADREVVRSHALAGDPDGYASPEARATLEQLIAERMAGVRVECPVVTLSEMIRETGIETIDLLKIDVQRAELDVLLGIERDDWPRIRQIAVEVHDERDATSVPELLRDHGFELLGDAGDFTGARRVLRARRPEIARCASAAPSDSGEREWRSPGALLRSLEAEVSRELPWYMLPARVALVAALPLAGNGKVDRGALRAAADAGLTLRRRPVAPLTPVEKSIAALWCELFELPEVAANTSFFELGGTSLMAASMAVRLSDALGTHVSMAEVLRHPTVAEMAKAFAGRNRTTSELPPIARAAARDAYPLTHQQRGLWISAQLGSNAAYNVARALRVAGAIDRAALDRAVRDVVARHEPLRTSFHMVDDAPGQVVREIDSIDEDDLRVRWEGRAPDDAGGARFVARAAAEPFDLERAPLLRVRALELAPDETVVSIVTHHIVTDGWSAEILLDDLLVAYAAAREGSHAPEPEPLQYKDFACWQAELASTPAYREAERYWLEKFTGPLEPLGLPLDRARPAASAHRGAVHTFEMDAPLVWRLRKLCQDRRVTLFALTTALIKAVLHRWTGRDDVVFGTTISGRSGGLFDGQMGYFAGTLLLRDRVEASDAFGDLLARSAATVSEALEHQAYPLDTLVANVAAPRRDGRAALLDVGFTWYEIDRSADVITNGSRGGLTVEEIEPSTIPARSDLWWFVRPQRSGLAWKTVYDADLFVPETIEHLDRELCRMASEVAANPERAVGELAFEPRAPRPALPTLRLRL